MSVAPLPATNVSRMLAVFIDFFVFFAAWIVFGAVFAVGSVYYALGFLFVLDVVLTAFLGISVGRWLTGIRVVQKDGRQPGLVPALLRTAIVFLTGWVGLFVFLVTEWFGHVGVEGSVPRRMWWDAAAATRLVSSKAVSVPGSC
ncbi:MAG TPA: RDD family protein [Candidatus Sulfotelmatobacter sp.]|nr:RDD family protein [Candidatus Sulfotelmatobacter sp.]